MLFETPSSLSDGLIQKADTSCLIMIEEIGRKLNLTVCNPDLALYRGISDDIFDENGKRIERSIYSRSWKSNKSQEIPVIITLKGKWNMKDTDKCKTLKSDNKHTILQFSCKDGASIGIELYK